jgi:telomerase reverse transcriptase
MLHAFTLHELLDELQVNNANLMPITIWCQKSLHAHADDLRAKETHTPSRLLALQDALCAILRQLCQRGGASKNVFSLGYRLQVGALNGVQCVYPNTLVDYVRSDGRWQLLLDRIGFARFSELFLRASLLLDVDGVFVQLCGEPLPNFMQKSAIDGGRSYHDVIERFSMFYALPEARVRGLPAPHEFNALRATATGARELLARVFLDATQARRQTAAPARARGVERKRRRRVRRGLRPLIRPLCAMLRRHKRCDYAHLIDRCCSLPPTDVLRCAAAAPLGDYLSCHSDATRVASFLRAAWLRVVPTALLGSARNVAAVAATIERFAQLRRFESIGVDELMHGVKLADVAWLRRAAQRPTQRVELMRRLLRALFARYLVPLLRAHFYCTESSAYRNRVFYFRHELWAAVQRAAVAQLSRPAAAAQAGERPLLRELSHAVATRMLGERSRRFGVASMRLLPKQSGVRPIVNLSKRDRSGSRSINSKLRPVHQVLAFECARAPDSLGASVFCYNDVYARLAKYAADARQQRGRIYIVCADIERSFDTIDQQRAFSVASSMFREHEYTVQRFSVTTPLAVAGNGGALSLFDDSGALSYSTPRFYNVIRAPDEFVQFIPFVASSSSLSLPLSSSHIFARRYKAQLQRRGSVATDQIVHNVWSRSSLLQLLREHIFSNVVRHNGRMFLQQTGIPQGSVLSSLLCSLYYGHVEAEEARQEPADGARQDTLLMRWIDDSLLLTADEAHARRYTARIHAPERASRYGCKANTLKTQLGGFSMAPFGADAGAVAWCGLIVGADDDGDRFFSVRADYARYASSYMSDCITASCAHGSSPGARLRASVMAAIEPKCHVVLLDEHISGARGVALNVYQMALLAAIKCHCHVVELEHVNERFLSDVIVDVAEHLARLVRQRVTNGLAKARRCRSTLRSAQLRWLALHAFVAVMKRKQSRYPSALASVREHLGALPLPCATLRAAVASKHNAIFDSIIY